MYFLAIPVQESFENDFLHEQPTSFENYAEVLAKLGYPVKLDFTSIFGSEKGDLNLLPETLWNKANTEVNRDIHSDEKPWIGLAPFAAHEGIEPLCQD